MNVYFSATFSLISPSVDHTKNCPLRACILLLPHAIDRSCAHFSHAFWFISSSADLPVVYDHNNPSADVEGVAKVIERDEYKVRKKPKGRAKFIGQSKVICVDVRCCKY